MTSTSHTPETDDAADVETRRTGRLMKEPAAARCVIWAASLAVVGIVVSLATPFLQEAVLGAPSTRSMGALQLVGMISAVLRWTVFPTAAALLGAAVVIGWMREHLVAQEPARRP